MSNRIKRVDVQQDRISTLEAELTVRVEIDGSAADVQIRGRVTGPKCTGIETVQVPYPLRPVPSVGSELFARVAIPEPNLWTEERPFVYEGVVELWVSGAKRDSAHFKTAFKMAD